MSFVDTNCFLQRDGLETRSYLVSLIILNISQYLHNTFKSREDKFTVIASVMDMRGEKYEEREMNKERKRKKEEIGFFIVTFFSV